MKLNAACVYMEIEQLVPILNIQHIPPFIFIYQLF